MLGWLEDAASSGKLNEQGSDNDLAWNDRHLQYVWLWLTLNELSPYCGAPNMLLAAMKIYPTLRSNYKKMFGAGKLIIRFGVRKMLTYRLKEVCSGKYTPRVDKRDRRGRVIRFTILEESNPTAYPIPVWYRGNLQITTKGLRVFVRRSEQVNAPRVSPNEAKDRLFNPFGTGISTTGSARGV